MENGGKENVLSCAREQDRLLADIIVNTIKRGGKILMPTLGSGRAQEVIIILDKLIREKKIPEVPLYIDGLVWDITAIHTAYPEFLNNTVRQQIFHTENNPFLAKNIKRVGSQKERKALIDEEGPCIVVATSGMLIGGPSVEYLKHLAENPKNSLVFSCYQAEGSLGRRIQRGEREIIFKIGQKNDIIPIKMEVHRIEISAHSDRSELLSFVGKCSPRPKKVIVNHGENSRILDMCSTIRRQYKIESVAPRNLDSIRLR